LSESDSNSSSWPRLVRYDRIDLVDVIKSLVFASRDATLL
jgi:hypothetical protein